MPSDFPTVIEFQQGLSPEPRYTSAENGFASELIGLRPSEQGFHSFVEIEHKSFGTLDWPFPQLLKDDQVTLFCERTRLSYVDGDNLTPIVVLDWDTGEAASFSAIEPWRLVAFQDIWFLTDGNTFIFQFGPEILATTLTKIPAMAKIDNRLFLGGMTGEHFDTDQWAELFQVWKDTVGAQVVVHENQVFSKDWVLWTTQAGGGPTKPFIDLIVLLGLIDVEVTPSLMSTIKASISRGEIGMSPIPTQGDIHAIREMGSSVYVFASDGVTTMVKSRTSAESSTLKSNYFVAFPNTSLGILSPYCVCGNEGRLFILTTSGLIMQLSADGLVRLGFGDYTKVMLDELDTLVSSYDEQEAECYFSSRTENLVLGEGASKTNEVPTSFVREETGLVGILEVRGEGFEIELEQERDNVRGLKFLTFCELHADNVERVEVGVGIKGSSGKDVNLPYKFGSPDNRFWLGASVDGYRLRVRGKALAGARLEKAVVKSQFADNRTVRGPRGTGTG